MGVCAEEPYPSSLCWTGQRDLLIVWADNFRHVCISAAAAGLGPEVRGEESVKVATIVSEWMTGSLICGLQGLGDEVDEEEVDSEESHVIIQPESMKSVQIVSADQLPLRRFNMSGPEAYMLLSSHQCKKHKGDTSRWQLRSYQSQRGGSRGYAPVFFVASPQDVVVARVRDVNDR